MAHASTCRVKAQPLISPSPHSLPPAGRDVGMNPPEMFHRPLGRGTARGVEGHRPRVWPCVPGPKSLGG